MNLISQRVGEKSLQNRYSTRDSHNSVGRQTTQYKKNRDKLKKLSPKNIHRQQIKT